MNARLRTAVRVMGRADGYVGSTAEFVFMAMEWLGHEVGELFLERNDDQWHLGFISGEKLADVLADAVIAVDEKRKTPA